MKEDGTGAGAGSAAGVVATDGGVDVDRGVVATRVRHTPQVRHTQVMTDRWRGRLARGAVTAATAYSTHWVSGEMSFLTVAVFVCG